MYRPNFCAECGAQIVRLNWRVWTSRRFCDACAPSFMRKQTIHLAVVGLMVFAFGLSIGRTVRTPTPPVVIQRNSTAPATKATAGPTYGTGANNTTTAEETVYMCGARTKKGTPCSRRVHGPVRCWQHKGMPAMLPADKLKVEDPSKK